MTGRLNIPDAKQAEDCRKATTMLATLVSLTPPAFAQQGQGGRQSGARFMQNRDISSNGHGTRGRGPAQIIPDPVTRPEFAQSNKRAFDMRDVNGDGKIDIADFR